MISLLRLNHSIPSLYPEEFRNIMVPKRFWDADARFCLADDAPRVPPTTIQISVRDVEPAVWASSYQPVKTVKNRTTQRRNINVGEMSHEEVRRQTERAIKRNIERKAEQEARKQKLKEARENRLKNPQPIKTPKPARKRPGPKPKLKPEPVPGTSGLLPVPKMAPKSVLEKLRADSPDITNMIKPESPTPRKTGKRNRRKSSPAVRRTPKTAKLESEDSSIENIPTGWKDPETESTSPESTRYENSVFLGLESELEYHLKKSPSKKSHLRNIFQPKLDLVEKRTEIKNSYENSVFRSTKAEIEATIFSKDFSFRRMMPPMLSRAMCDDAVRTFSCSSSENSPEKSPPKKSTKKNLRKKRVSKTSKALENPTENMEKNPKDPEEKVSSISPKDGFGRFNKIGFAKSNSPPESPPKNLRRLSKDYSPKKR